MNDIRTPRRIGILEMASPDPERLAQWDIFRRALRDHGHVDGGDVVLEFRWAEGRAERAAVAAAEFVGSGVDALITAGTPAAAAAIKATRDIPIIMATGVGLGTRLSDGGSATHDNVTGISDLPPGVSAKRIELLREALGRPLPLAMLADRANPSSVLAVHETQDVARALGIAVKDYWLAGPDDLGVTLTVMKDDGIAGFVVAPGAMFFARRRELAALARERGLASMAVRREYAEAGCLMAYGASLRENYRRAATIVSRILAGTRPADLPVEQPTEFEFVVNRTTARTLGLTVAPTLLSRAEMIES